MVLRLLVVMLIACSLAGCRRSRGFVSPYDYPTPLLVAGSISEVHDVVRERSSEHDVFWARGRINIRVPAERSRTWFDATFLYRHPDAIRLRGSRIPIGTLFEVILSGDRAYIHMARDRELYGGTLEELRREGGILGSVTLEDLAGVILVNHDLRRRLDAGGSWEHLVSRDEVYLTTHRDDGRRMTWRLRRRDGLVREVVVRLPNGRVELRARYAGYVLSRNPAEPYPREVTLELYDGALEVRWRQEEYRPNSDVRAENVDFLPRLVVRPLSGLSDRESPLPPDAPE